MITTKPRPRRPWRHRIGDRLRKAAVRLDGRRTVTIDLMPTPALSNDQVWTCINEGMGHAVDRVRDANETAIRERFTAPSTPTSTAEAAREPVTRRR